MSMVVILLITVGAIVIPWFWPYTYKEQDLNLANVPAVMETYPLGQREERLRDAPVHPDRHG